MSLIFTFAAIYAVLGIAAGYGMSRRRCPAWVAGVVGGFFGLGMLGNFHRISGRPVTVQDVGMFLQGTFMVAAAIAATMIRKRRNNPPHIGQNGNGV